MKVSASKIWNKSNNTKIVLSQNKKSTYLAVTSDVWSNQRNNELRRWSMKMSTSKPWNESSHNCLLSQNKKKHLPCCSRWCYIESKKQWMRVMKYKGDCIKTMEWVESHKNCINMKQKIHLPCCYQQWMIEFKRQRMRVTKYEGECIKNMEWVELYEIFIK